MQLRSTFLLSFFAASSLAGAADDYVKELTFPADATLDQKIEMASRLVPNQKQLDWQDLELTAFLHFGVNTFTDREWGDGNESPAVFNPVGLDARQWVATLKNAGFKLVILTAKHHDGFCLWPSAATNHTVAASPWRDGRGDVVRELRKACDEYGMKMGVYLSPWDRNAECYGDSPRYNDMFVAQLTELLGNYGTIDEVWFDGACAEGPNGKKQVYDWERFKEVIHRMQPGAVVAIMGDDVRWVGNEKGLGRETEWSVTALTPGIYPHAAETNERLGIYETAPDLGSRDIVSRADKLYWWPSEVDVSIRPGWFYHPDEQPKSLRQLAEIYVNSVGRNSVLLLNVPPDRNGRIDSADSLRLMELRRWIDTNFTDDLAARFDRKKLVATFRHPAEVNTVVLGENITRGQRVEQFVVEARIDGRWQQVTEATTIGKKRILMFPTVKADALRMVPKSVRGKADIASMQAYLVEMPADEGPVGPRFRKLPTTSWTAVGDKAEAKAAFDGDDSTVWIAPTSTAAADQSLTINLGSACRTTGFTYMPPTAPGAKGTILRYSVYASPDGQTWTEIPTSGEFSNIKNNPIKQYVTFSAPVVARFFRIVAHEDTDGGHNATIAEIELLTAE